MQLAMFLNDFELANFDFQGADLFFTIVLLTFYLQIVVNPLVLFYMGDEYRKVSELL